MYHEKRLKEPWLKTSLVLGLCGGSRERFMEAQLAFATEEDTLLDELRHGLFLGDEEVVEDWKERLEKERHREKPQVRSAFRDQNISKVVEVVFSKLGVLDPAPLLKPIRRKKRPNRDLAIYILCHLGTFTNQEIGHVFGVGYTSINGSLKRARSYMDAEKDERERVDRILNDI
jgi:hypothetical protein